MLKQITDKLRAAKRCRDSGHDWRPDGTRYDCDGGMGGGRELYAFRCSRCGKTAVSVFPAMNDT